MAIDSGSIYSSVRIRLSSLDGDIKGVYARLDQLESKVNTKVSKPTKALTSSFNVMSLAGAAAFLKIGSAAASTLSTYADFEQQMANVASVAGATSGEFDQLNDAASKAGETTRYTASQAADALYYLSSAGFDASQSIGALDGVLSLAQATGSDLATTSSSMASTISQFGLAAEDAGRVSNVFAAAITSSQANMEKLTAGLRQAGPVAGTLGISLEEVTANLDALYNKGFQGEQAGTALRSIMLDLADSTSSVVTGLEAQGIAYDSINPKMVGLSGAMETLANSGIDLTTIFGKESASQALALVEVAGKATDNLSDLEKEITNTNKAAEAMAIQNDTLKGSLDLLKSKSEATGNTFAKDFTPALREIIDVAGSVITAIGKFPAPLRVATASLGLVAVAIGGVASAASVLGITINATLPVIAAIGLALAGVMTATTLITKHFNDQKNTTLELNMATANLKTTSNEYNGVQKTLAEKADKLTAAEKEVYEGRKKLLALKMADELTELSKVYDKTNKGIEKQKEHLAEVNKHLEEQRKALSGAYWQQENLSESAEKYKQTHLEKILAEQRDAEENLTKAETDRQESINGIAKAVANGTINIDVYKTTNKELYNEIMAQVANLNNVEFNGILGEIEKLSALSGDNFNTTKANIIQEIEASNLLAGSKQKLLDALNLIKAATDDNTDSTKGWKKALQEALNVENISTGANAISEYTDGITESLNRALEAAKTTGGDVSEVYQNYADEVNSAIIALIESGEYKQGEDTIQALLALRDSFAKNVTPDTSGYDSEINKLEELKIKYTEGEIAATRFNLSAQGWSTDQIDDYIKKLEEVNDLAEKAGEKQLKWHEIVENAADGVSTALGTVASYYSQASTTASSAEDAWVSANGNELDSLQAKVDAGEALTEAEKASYQSLADKKEELAEATLKAQEKAFEAGKAASFATTAISGEQAAVSAYGALAGIPVVGPGLGLAAALAVGGFTAASLASIASQEFTPMATGGIIEPTNNGTITRQAENGYGEVDFNTGPSGQKFISQMGKQLAKYQGNTGSTVIQFTLSGKALKTFTKEITRIQKNGDA